MYKNQQRRDKCRRCYVIYLNLSMFTVHWYAILTAQVSAVLWISFIPNNVLFIKRFQVQNGHASKLSWWRGYTCISIQHWSTQLGVLYYRWRFMNKIIDLPMDNCRCLTITNVMESYIRKPVLEIKTLFSLSVHT